MKNFIMIFILLLTLSCKSNTEKMPVEIIRTEQTKTWQQQYEECASNSREKDSIIAEVRDSFHRQDSMISDLIKKKQPVGLEQKKIDSLKALNNKLGKKLLHSELIITNAKFYLNIANKNPSQQKFLRGWMNRALNQ